MYLFMQVAIICNHQRTVSKTHSAQMSRLNEKIEELKVMTNCSPFSINLCVVLVGVPICVFFPLQTQYVRASSLSMQKYL